MEGSACSDDAVLDAMAIACEADRFTRAVVVCSPDRVDAWVRACSPHTRVERVCHLGGRNSVGNTAAHLLIDGARRLDVIAVGERLCRPGLCVDQDALRFAMDPIESGEGGLPKAWKRGVAHTPYPRLDPAAWQGKGFPDRIIRLVTEGATIEPFELPHAGLDE